MLQIIREYTQGWIATVIIAIIILTFALWGIHSYFVHGENNNIVASVNNQSITRAQLNVVYERLHREMQAQGRPLINPKEEIALKEQALQILIEIEVLKQAAIKQGFFLSTIQVENYLQQMPQFQVNGEFSLTRFHELVSNAGFSTPEFIELIRTHLLIDQPKLGIIFSSFALDAETEDFVSLANQERLIEYILLPFHHFDLSKISIAEQDVNAYYKAHSAEFMTPEQVSVDYLELSIKNILATLQPSEAELKSFYNENINLYTQAGEKPKIYSFSTVREKVKQAYLKQKSEEKFAEQREQLADLTYEHPESLQIAAKTLKLPIKTSEFFAKDQEGKDIAQYKKIRQVAFSNDMLELQNNSEVIQIAPDTVVVLHLKSHQNAKLLALKDVNTQIKTKLKQQAVETQTKALADTIIRQLRAGAQLPQNIAAKYHLIWQQVGYQSRGSKKIDPIILETAFRLPHPNNNQGIYEISPRMLNGYAIVGVRGIKKGQVSDRNQMKGFIEQTQVNQGLLEYELYKLSQMKKAKINVE